MHFLKDYEPNQSHFEEADVVQIILIAYPRGFILLLLFSKLLFYWQ